MSHAHQLVVIMFTDIVGYTALMGEDEEKAFKILKKNKQVQKPLIEKYDGKWLKEIGDGVIASFSSVSDAMYAADEMDVVCVQCSEHAQTASIFSIFLIARMIQ